ncbi:hypothetical protein FKM82_025790 [Ascaphus truei]
MWMHCACVKKRHHQLGRQRSFMPVTDDITIFPKYRETTWDKLSEEEQREHVNKTLCLFRQPEHTTQRHLLMTSTRGNQVMTSARPDRSTHCSEDQVC